MSWNMSGKGTKASILGVVKAQTDNGMSDVQKAQLQAAKDFVTAEVSAMPDPPAGTAITLASNGHADDAQRYLSIQTGYAPA